MYRITADVEYLDGFLRGLCIKGGHAYTVPDQETAIARVSRLHHAERTGDFFRAAVTGHRYRVLNIRAERI